LEIAAHLLEQAGAVRRVERFSLGAALGQCCGGVVELYWERFDAPEQLCVLASAPAGSLRYCAMDGVADDLLVAPGKVRAALPEPAGRASLLRIGARQFFVERLGRDATPLWLYGAGHVGRALVRVLTDLPFDIHWVDSRPDYLDEAVAQAPGVIPWAVEDPADAAAFAPAGAWHLVMTHSHEDDLNICEALLRRERFGYLGMIGSRSKDARFRHRLLGRGCAPAAVDRLVCPIGQIGITSKVPAAIAVAVAAELLLVRERAVCAVPISSVGALRS
jgi:xanthine dehydrogenase accessory factor